jgi:ferritin-like metal-binding protein YciE
MESGKVHVNDGSLGWDSSLLKFFTAQLQAIYGVEKHLVKALPEMASQATAMALKDLFTYHFAETREHKIRLETAFDMMNVNGKAVKSESMAAILDEQQGEKDIYDNEGSGVILDAEVIFMSQKAEQEEIAVYGGLVVLAKTLHIPGIADLLVQTLEEEKATSQRLSEIFERLFPIQPGREMNMNP